MESAGKILIIPWKPVMGLVQKVEVVQAGQVKIAAGAMLD